ILGARVVTGHDRVIGQPLGDPAHLRPLATIAIATASEHHDQPTLRKWPHGHERTLECIARVGVAAQYSRTLVDPLETTRNLTQVREHARDVTGRHSECPRGGRSAKRVRDVEVADERQLHLRTRAARLELPFASAWRVPNAGRANISILSGQREAHL